MAFYVCHCGGVVISQLQVKGCALDLDIKFYLFYINGEIISIM